jgi:hypothetical protein
LKERINDRVKVQTALIVSWGAIGRNDPPFVRPSVDVFNHKMSVKMARG